MERINYDDLSIKNNGFEIRLPRWFITLNTYVYDGQINCVMNVMDEEHNKAFFFDTLEESFTFINNVVISNNDITLIDKCYEDYLKKPKQFRKK